MEEKILVIVGRGLSVRIHDTISGSDNLKQASLASKKNNGTGLCRLIGYWVDESATCTVFYKRDLTQKNLSLIQEDLGQDSLLDKNREKKDLEKKSLAQKNIGQDSEELAIVNCYAQRQSSLTVYFLIDGARKSNTKESEITNFSATKRSETKLSETKLSETGLNASAESGFVDSVASDLQLNCYLLGEYAEIKIDGAYMLCDAQRATVSVYQEHLVSHTISNVMVKSVLKDAAYICYKGLIYIGINAPYTDAVQNNKNIIVGDKARAHSIPSLEILNNEVRCAHGSAVGSFDKEQLFILQSRGLDLARATQILIDGFIGQHFNSLW